MPKTIPPKKSKDILITQEMLFEVRDELKHAITSHRLENKAKFKNIDSQFKNVDARFDRMDANFEKVLAEVHRIGLLVEEQNARNKFVLDGYNFLNRRIEKMES